jgi:hypothetical protein
MRAGRGAVLIATAVVVVGAAAIAFWRGVGANALAFVLVCAVVAALVALVAGMQRETKREMALVVREVNDGFIALARDLGFSGFDPGEAPFRQRSDAHFERVAGTYRGVAISIAVDANIMDSLRTKMTLLLPRPAPSLSPRTFAALVESSEVTDRWLALYVSARSRGFWTRPLLTYDSLPESDPARLRSLLDRSIELAGLAGSSEP